ncbi:hypothetical protein BHF71_11255 [Vulcanibacillus modesticaldus]|uniref:Uncharacterized protein n=1 Tax=Vulcanibacillus modesticaldus TaxID=337097 RepID=A0A1D2YS73_9BACI|nr:hypothetical protein BHF71_11255 [Vulcanibacillus modesticaldus]
MLISTDRNPEYSLYYLGAIILDILYKYKCIEIDLLFKSMNEKITKKLPIDYLYYSLDWLFLLDLIKLNGDKIELCLLKD